MGFDPHEPEQRGQLRNAMAAADITVPELWLRYFSMSGSAGEYEVHAYVQGLISLPVTQRDLLALAANEIIDEKPLLYAPYADQLMDSSEGDTVLEEGQPMEQRLTDDADRPGRERRPPGQED